MHTYQIPDNVLESSIYLHTTITVFGNKPYTHITIHTNLAYIGKGRVVYVDYLPLWVAGVVVWAAARGARGALGARGARGAGAARGSSPSTRARGAACPAARPRGTRRRTRRTGSPLRHRRRRGNPCKT